MSSPTNRLQGFLRCLKQSFDENLLFWITLPLGIYVFLFVPQIRNIWRQGPPPGLSPWYLALGYFAFVGFLLFFYVSSLFAVMECRPLPHFRAWLSARRADRKSAWESGGSRISSILRFAPCGFFLLPYHLSELSCRLLVWMFSSPAPSGESPSVESERLTDRKLRRRLWVWFLLVLVLAASMWWLGVAGDSSRGYTLAGALCRMAAGWLTMLAAWLGVQAWRQERDRQEWLDRLGRYQARLLSWLLATHLSAEMLWIAACTKSVGDVFSYRLYTIWAAIQLLTATMIFSLLLDYWHRVAIWPIRLAGLALVPLVLWLGDGVAVVERDDFQRYLSADQLRQWRQAPVDDAQQVEQRNRQWFEDFEARILKVPEGSGPVVIVAASGGGSRAAIFTAAALETLDRTPLDPKTDFCTCDSKQPNERTWGDNVVLISSVSGGSLAAAYHAHDLDPENSSFQEMDALRNTTKGELILRLQKQGERLVEDYRNTHPGFDKPPDIDEGDAELAYWQQQRQALPADQQRAKDIDEFLELLWLQKYWRELEKAKGNETQLEPVVDEHPELRRCRWVLRSHRIDEMGMDFMAPILRGVLTPAFNRGNALGRFWTERFDWHGDTNFGGYRRLGSTIPVSQRHYDGSRPLILFNASDVAKGSRLVVGFPPLPADLWEHVYEDQQSRERPKTLAEVNPGYRISLARAVRMSSNFPWGFRVMGIPRTNPHDDPVHVLDGGVVDNTGLDTLYELFNALQWCAQKVKPARPYHDVAKRILRHLRLRGVVLLEIDSGSKPNPRSPHGVFAAVVEPAQGLDNAAYTGADQTKQIFRDKLSQIFTPSRQNLLDAANHEGPAPANGGDHPAPSTMIYLQFQCNHYNVRADTAQDAKVSAATEPDVMTAWALGPADKAEVLSRFLLELGRWDERRRGTIVEFRKMKQDLSPSRIREELRKSGPLFEAGRTRHQEFQRKLNLEAERDRQMFQQRRNRK